MSEPLYPTLYQINTRVWMTELSKPLRRPATLDDISDETLDRLADNGFDWIWLLSVWQLGDASRRVSRSNPEWRREFQRALPDLRDDDIAGSGFAITGYTVNPGLGGDAALARLRERFRKRGLRLMLDFVPNHTALDHPWVESYPELYLRSTEKELASAPHNYARVARYGTDDLIVAHGRDPNFPGWCDTLQLDYSNPATQDAMGRELLRISAQCDGVRCDMAMLVLPDVFARTWGRSALPFWPNAIRRVRERMPNFTFMAEVYWDLEWTMLQQGFDYAYDKRLYDRLRNGQAASVREHLRAGLDYQNKLARFLENHDEKRAASTFASPKHQAAAVVTYLAPGLRFLHQGQLEGRLTHTSPHLIRAPVEPVNEPLRRFYGNILQLLKEPIFREGVWQLLDCAPAWEGNSTWDCFVASAWQLNDRKRALVVVNYADNQSQCYLPLSSVFSDLRGVVQFKDLLSSATYQRAGDELHARGLYLDLPPWCFHVFEVTTP